MTTAAGGDFRSAGDVALKEQFDNHDGFRPEQSVVDVGRYETLVLVGLAEELTIETGTDGKAAWTLGSEHGDCDFESFVLREDATAFVARVDERRSVFAVVCGDRGIAAYATLEDRSDGGVSESTRYVQFGIGAAPKEPLSTLPWRSRPRSRWTRRSVPGPS